MIRRLLDSFAASRSPRRRAPSRASRFESLETRDLMAHMAVLDFDGAAVTAAQLTEGQWPDRDAVNVSSFGDLFTSARPMLDLDGNGHVNSNDAQLAIDRIVAKVRQDFSPYNLTIVVGNLNDHSGLLTDSQVGDVMVIVSGGANHISSESANGIAPFDLGNERDEIAWVFGQPCLNNMTTADGVINSVARTISHEMAHTFGLAHITATPTGMADAHSHHLMGVEIDSLNPARRDYAHDFTFQDITYQTNALDFPDEVLSEHSPHLNTADQNSHRYLSDPAVLGPSNRPWIAMLKPGELTINGDGSGNTINVTQSFTISPLSGRVEHWSVSASAVHYVKVGAIVASQTTTATAGVDPLRPGIRSLNPYSTPVTKIVVNALGGDDTITVAPNITANLWAFGGSGKDTITGGAGIDRLHGEAGDDKLYGGNAGDYLFGGIGTDELHGQAGNDYLYGDTGNTDDGVLDFLYGETGRDTIHQKKSYVWAPITPDSFVDYAASEDWIIRFDMVYSLS